MSWVKHLLREYGKGKRDLQKYRDTLIRENPAKQTDEERAEISVVNGMISDLQYAIDWMRTGRRPYSRRGVEIRDAYSHAILMDMDLLPNVSPTQELVITEKQKRELAIVLVRMSSRERQCYLLHMAQGMTLSEIAKEMRLSKNTVRDYIDRAKNKIPPAL